MVILRFEPIATQLARLMAMDELLPARVLEEAERNVPGAGVAEPGLRDFMVSYVAVTHAAYRLLGAPQFERLSRLHDQLEEEYAPGGPPRSPIYDSFSVQHVLADVPVGVANETPFSVLARLTRGDAARAALHDLTRSVAESHHDVYRVIEAAGSRAALAHVHEGRELNVHLTGPALSEGDLVLARVLTFRGGAFIADAPCLLLSSEGEWRAYLERATAGDGVAAAHAERTPSPKVKLSPKQLARRRKEQKSPASPRDALARHLKFGPSERYWLDYILLAYAGERRGLVYLEGVPDRAETLPHHALYQPERAPARSVEATREPPRAEVSASIPQRITARYVIIDRDRALKGLSEAFTRVASEQYRWLDASGGVLADLEVDGETLSLRVESSVRLARAKARIEAALGAAVKPSVELVEGDIEPLRSHAERGALSASIAASPSASRPPVIGADMTQRVHEALLDRIRAALDQPLPMFGGRSVRQLASTEQGRDEAKAWLVEQERLLAADPELGPINLGPLWTELGLDRKGSEREERRECPSNN